MPRRFYLETLILRAEEAVALLELAQRRLGLLWGCEEATEALCDPEIFGADYDEQLLEDIERLEAFLQALETPRVPVILRAGKGREEGQTHGGKQRAPAPRAAGDRVVHAVRRSGVGGRGDVPDDPPGG